MSNRGGPGEAVGVNVTMSGILEKFDGDWPDGNAPREALTERLTIENDKVVKKETFENGKLVSTEDYV